VSHSPDNQPIHFKEFFMSTYIDFSYRFEGKPADIAFARSVIANIRAEYEDWEGMEYEPSGRGDGSLDWSGFGKFDLQPFDRMFANLTRGNAMKAWAYVGCTDGCCEGWLSLLEKGSLRMVDRWEADIGLRSAMAAVKLSKKADVDAVLTLIDRVGIADDDGWDEYDWSHLRAGGVCSVLLANAVFKHPELLQSAKVAEALKGVAKGMADIHKHLRKYKAMSKADISTIDELLAASEGLEIATVVKPCKVAKRIAVRI
jgi:hypothetical protein